MADPYEHRWLKHTATHWQIRLSNGFLLDYWPSSSKYLLRGEFDKIAKGTKSVQGDVYKFIADQEGTNGR